MFGNHFRILNARMVQSVESVWTVLISGSVSPPPWMLFKRRGKKRGKKEEKKNRKKIQRLEKKDKKGQKIGIVGKKREMETKRIQFCFYDFGKLFKSAWEGFKNRWNNTHPCIICMPSYFPLIHSYLFL